METTTLIKTKSDPDWEETEEQEDDEDIESSLDSEANLTLTKKRSRRELMKMSSVELDVATPQLLIVDRDENIYSSQTCISKSLVPLMPISFVTIIMFTVAISISCYKHWFMPKKALLFY